MAIELSICIPTWNRAGYLPPLLDSLLPQVTEEVEVVVSDNASEDDTPRILEEYGRRFPRLAYHRRERNEGADRNYLNVVEYASGRYCWLCGSDDLAAPGAVGRILRLAREREHEIFLSDRFEFHGNDSSRAKRVSWSSLPGDVLVDPSRDPAGFVRYVDSLDSIGGLFSFLTSIVVRRDAWNAVPGRETFVGTLYSHAHVLLEVLRGGGRMLYVREPFVLCRIGNDAFLDDPVSPEARYRRIRYDIVGYRDIPSRVFGADSAEAEAILRLLDRMYPPHELMKLKERLLRSSGAEWALRLERLARASGLLPQFLALRLASGPAAPLLRRLLRAVRRW